MSAMTSLALLIAITTAGWMMHLKKRESADRSATSCEASKDGLMKQSTVSNKKPALEAGF